MVGRRLGRRLGRRRLLRLLQLLWLGRRLGWLVGFEPKNRKKPTFFILDFKVCKNTSVLFLTLQSEEIENVVNKGSKFVVRARRDNGSGVVWNSDGLILTCNHIVRKLDDYEAILNNGKLFQPRNVPYTNIALLKIQSNDDNISLNPIEESLLLWS
jgi:S1-C subfamily serine protease